MINSTELTNEILSRENEWNKPPTPEQWKKAIACDSVVEAIEYLRQVYVLRVKKAEHKGDAKLILQGAHDAVLLKECYDTYEIIVAYGYDDVSGEWIQGHYFTAYQPNSAEKIQVLQDALDFWKKMEYK